MQKTQTFLEKEPAWATANKEHRTMKAYGNALIIACVSTWPIVSRFTTMDEQQTQKKENQRGSVVTSSLAWEGFNSNVDHQVIVLLGTY